MVIAAWLWLGCSSPEPESSATTTELFEMDDYHGLSEGASWTYRDDSATDAGMEEASTEEPLDEELLLRARHLGGGAVEVRRGTRWADATPTASLIWDSSEGLSLLAWDHPAASGSGRLPFADADPAVGETMSAGGWTCTASTPAEVWTFYGVFEDCLQFSCTGDTALAGEWIFANGHGLVSLDASFALDLVAPW